MEYFSERYLDKSNKYDILDFGSHDINGSYRKLLSPYEKSFIGIDLDHGQNVTYVPDDVYNWSELAPNSVDLIILFLAILILIDLKLYCFLIVSMMTSPKVSRSLN